MPSLTYPTPPVTTDTVISSSDINGKFAAVATLLNNTGLDTTNVQAGGIDISRLGHDAGDNLTGVDSSNRGLVPVNVPSTGVRWNEPVRGLGGVDNVSLTASATSSALTVTMRSLVDSSASPSNSQPSKFVMGQASSSALIRTGSAALSITIPSTATLGYSSATTVDVYVYAVFYAGAPTTPTIGVSAKKWDDTQSVPSASLAAISIAATSRNVIYTPASGTGAAFIRLLGVVHYDALTTAGTWTAPTYTTPLRPGVEFHRTAAVTRVSSAYTVTVHDEIVEVSVTGGGGSPVITLPDARTFPPGQRLEIRCIGSVAGTGDTAPESAVVTPAQGSVGGWTTRYVYPGMAVVLVSGGTVGWYTVSGAVGDFVRAYTGNGHGSTNTKIRRFSSSMTWGSAVTYADSGTDGASFTINVPGLYSVSTSDTHGAAAAIEVGLSVNATAYLTTNISGVTAAQGAIGYVATPATASIPATHTITRWFNTGDVVRPHTNGVATSTSGAVHMSVTKVG